jgi:hypothetical protein
MLLTIFHISPVSVPIFVTFYIHISLIPQMIAGSINRQAYSICMGLFKNSDWVVKARYRQLNPTTCYYAHNVENEIPQIPHSAVRFICTVHLQNANTINEGVGIVSICLVFYTGVKIVWSLNLWERHIFRMFESEVGLLRKTFG